MTNKIKEKWRNFQELRKEKKTSRKETPKTHDTKDTFIHIVNAIGRFIEHNYIYGIWASIYVFLSWQLLGGTKQSLLSTLVIYAIWYCYLFISYWRSYFAVLGRSKTAVHKKRSRISVPNI